MKVKSGVLNLIVLQVLASLLLYAAARAHDGDNPVFNTDASSGPKEVAVDEQGMRALAIKTVKAEPAFLRESLRASGEVQADETRAFNVNAPVSGVVRAVFAKQGDLVKKGQVLAILNSVDIAARLTQSMSESNRLAAELARLQTRYSGDISLQSNQLELARLAAEREEKLFKEGISARKSLLEAKNALDSALLKLDTLKKSKEQEIDALQKQLLIANNTAREQLKIMGLADKDIDLALKSAKVTTDLSVRAPLAGSVLARDITLGERVETGKSIFSIVNLSPVWVMIDIFQEQAPQVKEGQTVLLETAAKEKLSGKVSSVGSVVDAQKKTLHLRVIADNPKGILRPGAFVNAEILLGDGKRKALLLPEQAVVSYKDQPYIYLHHADEGHFEPVQVKLGEKAGGQVEISDGLQEGEIVVVSGASQLLAQSILDPQGGHQHEGEKHDAHNQHEHETPVAQTENSRAQLFTGFGLGFAFAIVLAAAFVLLKKQGKKPE